MIPLLCCCLAYVNVINSVVTYLKQTELAVCVELILYVVTDFGQQGVFVFHNKATCVRTRLRPHDETVEKQKHTNLTNLLEEGRL